MTRASYRRYLKSPHWRALRRRWYATNPCRCHHCGVTGGPLELHHLTYARIGRERLSDLVAVCPACHSALHRKPKRRRR